MTPSRRRGGGGAGPDARSRETLQSRPAVAEHGRLRRGGEDVPAGQRGGSLAARGAPSAVAAGLRNGDLPSPFSMALPVHPLTRRSAEAPLGDWYTQPWPRFSSRALPGPALTASQTPSPATAPCRPFGVSLFSGPRVRSLVHGAARMSAGAERGVPRRPSAAESPSITPPRSLRPLDPGIGSEYLKAAFIHLFFLVIHLVALLYRAPYPYLSL